MVLSRRRVASFLADGLTTKRPEHVRLAAAWLVDRRRQSELPLLVRDVTSILAERGYFVATATTAEAISDELLSNLTAFIKASAKASEVELTTELDASIIGGVKLTLPDTVLDATVKTKLQNFVTEMSR